MRTNKKLHFLLGLVLAWASVAHASSTRSIDADTIKNPAHTVTSTMPSVTGTLMSSATMVQEVPSGTCNGSNTAFTLAHTPSGSATVFLFVDGLLLTQGAGKDYTISSAAITLASATSCSSGQSMYAVYAKP